MSKLCPVTMNLLKIDKKRFYAVSLVEELEKF